MFLKLTPDRLFSKAPPREGDVEPSRLCLCAACCSNWTLMARSTASSSGMASPRVGSMDWLRIMLNWELWWAGGRGPVVFARVLSLELRGCGGFCGRSPMLARTRTIRTFCWMSVMVRYRYPQQQTSRHTISFCSPINDACCCLN